MPRITILIGAVLIVLGVGLYFGTGAKSITAMIPTFIGVPVALLGAVAAVKADSEKVRKHTAHVAVMLTLIGLIGGTVVGVTRIGKEGKETVVIGTLSMAALCLLHVVLSVRSFIAARKARQAGGPREG